MCGVVLVHYWKPITVVRCGAVLPQRESSQNSCGVVDPRYTTKTTIGCILHDTCTKPQNIVIQSD